MNLSKGEAARLAVDCFEAALDELHLDRSKWWLAVYTTLMWYEHDFLHIVEANALREQAIWQTRARAAEEYLAGQIGCETTMVKEYCDRLMRTPRYVGRQRQNPLGVAFTALINHIITKASGSRPEVEFLTEAEPKRYWPGVIIPGRSTSPKVDILGLRHGLPNVVFSAKWSLRHDRVSDIIQECPVYKQAAYMINRITLRYYVVTNEFSPARLTKIISDPCVDKVVHVHKPLLTEVLALDGRLDELTDLTEFINESAD
jgi:hypothetical protein